MSLPEIKDIYDYFIKTGDYILVGSKSEEGSGGYYVIQQVSYKGDSIMWKYYDVIKVSLKEIMWCCFKNNMLFSFIPFYITSKILGSMFKLLKTDIVYLFDSKTELKQFQHTLEKKRLKTILKK